MGIITPVQVKISGIILSQSDYMADSLMNMEEVSKKLIRQTGGPDLMPGHNGSQAMHPGLNTINIYSLTNLIGKDQQALWEPVRWIP